MQMKLRCYEIMSRFSCAGRTKTELLDVAKPWETREACALGGINLSDLPSSCRNHFKHNPMRWKPYLRGCYLYYCRTLGLKGAPTQMTQLETVSRRVSTTKPDITNILKRIPNVEFNYWHSYKRPIGRQGSSGRSKTRVRKKSRVSRHYQQGMNKHWQTSAMMELGLKINVALLVLLFEWCPRSVRWVREELAL